MSQKVDGKMIFTWSFWAFHDIPGLEKYGFSSSEEWQNNNRMGETIAICKRKILIKKFIREHSEYHSKGRKENFIKTNYKEIRNWHKKVCF